MTPTWRYHVETVGGNFHSAVEFLNKHHSEWDVVTMTTVDSYTMILYREKIK